MQCHDLAHANARLARVLASVEPKPGKPRWEPSREEMLKMRQLSRSGCSLIEAHKAINPPVLPEAFSRKARALGIRYGKCGVRFVLKYETAR